MPLPLLAAAIPGLVQTGIGLVQSITGHSKEKTALNDLENLKTPTYTGNRSITDFYNNALQRYGVNPYQSQQYQYGINAGNRNLAAGIGALQNRQSAVGGISRLTALSNDNALKAGINAENEQSRRFGQLQGATQMKAGDDMTRFQQNEIAPYEKQYNLLAMKAGAGGNQLNSGMQNAFGGLSNLSLLGSDYANNQSYGASSSQSANSYGVPSSYYDYLRYKRMGR